jgi:pimeloyl-ACP methyl ester carboxylesterase
MDAQHATPPIETGLWAVTGGSRPHADARGRLLAGIPASERWLQLAGMATSFLQSGEGAPLVLLHGPGEFAGKWVRVIPGLAGANRVIAPDLPAHGASGVPEDGVLDVERTLAWLDELIERTCSEPPVIVGHVLGGAIAARFAIERPKRLRRLVLVDTLGLARFRPAPRFAITMIGFQAAPSERTYNRFMRQCSLDFDRLREEMGDRWEPFVAYSLEGVRGPNSRSVGRLLRQVGLPRIPHERLARISVPTDLIWGRQDRANRLRIAEEASARYEWPLHVIENCADDPARDRPEAFLETLRAILGHPATGP